MKMRYQKGVSTWTMMAWLYLIISIAFCATKIAPAFVDDLAIKKAVESIDREGNLNNLGLDQIKNRLLQVLSINGIRNFDAKKLILKKEEKYVALDINYEVRVNFYKNVDAIMSFTHHYELGTQ